MKRKLENASASVMDVHNADDVDEEEEENDANPAT